MPDKLDRGKEIEELVQKTCAKIFASDFVIRNPMYKKISGDNKEAADFLVPFKDHLLVFQVKSKTELKKRSQKTETDFERIEKKIIKAIKQFKAIKEAMKNNLLPEIENCVGIKFLFKPETFNKIMCFVILDLLGEEQFTEEERTTINNGFHFDGDFPIHILLRQDFDLIASELDTLPDFLKYINLREQLYKNQILSPFTSEKEFLSLFKLHPDILEHITVNNINHIAIDPNIWNDYQKNEQQGIKDFAELIKHSYLVDEIISWLHTCVGYSVELGTIIHRNDLTQGSVENYFASVTELSSLSRMDRKHLADRLFHVMKVADESEGQISTILIQHENAAFLVFATKESRDKRVVNLERYACMAYCKLELKKIVAISTENLSSSQRSYDVIFMKDVIFENKALIIEEAKNLFNFSKG